MSKKMKFKKLHKLAKEPLRANKTDAGMDLYATSISNRGDIVTYGTGIAVEIPEGCFGLLTNRSSVYKKDLQINTGIIDSGYRGEILVKFRRTSSNSYGGNIYDMGERIAQLIIIPYLNVELEEGELDSSVRGNKGFGSSGK